MDEAMELGLAGKTAIITGASAGIGLACAKALYREGVNVVIVARNKGRLEAAGTSIEAEKQKGNPQIVTVNGDLLHKDTAQQVVQTALTHFEKIDILVNNAGSARAGSFLDLDEEAFLDAWHLKLLGYIRMVKAVTPHMMEQRDGRIVNIVGGAGRTPNAKFLTGSTANAAILNFSRGISRELASYNVRINGISPGLTCTERVERLAEQHAAANGISVEEQKVAQTAAIPLGKLVEPSEIAAMALLLASDLVPSMTGTEIVIDGGQQPGV
jgi:NAD(P)-dependent dehydrogenase (short-subunit alcohol dehydrogenase family)